MIFCARATRGRGLPSLDARNGDPGLSLVAHLAHPAYLAHFALQFGDDSYLMRMGNATQDQPVSDR